VKKQTSQPRRAGLFAIFKIIFPLILSEQSGDNSKSWLTASPAFVVAKGGITSSDVGVKALRVKCAKVLGQIRPGIPVWQTGAESLFPGHELRATRP